MTRSSIVWRLLRALLLLLALIAAALLAVSRWQQRDRASTAELLERPKAHDARIVRDICGGQHIFGTKQAAA